MFGHIRNRAHQSIPASHFGTQVACQNQCREWPSHWHVLGKAIEGKKKRLVSVPIYEPKNILKATVTTTRNTHFNMNLVPKPKVSLKS